MSDEASESSTADEFTSSFESPEDPDWDVPGEEGSSGGASASFALDMARLWVQEHQKASMLGAFAVGVFVGAMLRD